MTAAGSNMSKLRFGRLKSLGCWKLSRKVWRTSSNISKLRLASAACCVADSYGVCRAAYAGYVYSVGTYCSLQGREDLGRAVDRLSAGPPRKTPSLWVKKERERTGQEDEGEGAEGAEGGVGRAFQSPGPAPRGDFGAFFSLLARCSDGSPACRTAPAPLSPNIGVHPNSLLPLRRLSNLESYASHLCSQRQRPAVVWSAWCDDGSTG